MINNNIDQLINEGYKIMKFERDVDVHSGQEIGRVEVKALDGYREYIEFDDNAADEIEKNLFEYLREK